MKRDVIWGYLSQFLQYGASLLLLPLLLRKLDAAELGIWYVFISISAFVSMLDMGLSPTISRNVSYIASGAKQLLKDSFITINPTETDKIDYGLLQAVISASKRIYLGMACLAFTLLASIGTWYIYSVSKGHIKPEILASSWIIFVIATWINVYYKFYSPILQGRGLFAEFYRCNAIANIAGVAVTAVLIYFGSGLPGVALGFLVSSLTGRWLSWKYLYDQHFLTNLGAAPEAPLSTWEIFKLLWHNAWRLGLGVVGAFLILRANTFLASAYLGLSITAQYAIAVQLYTALQSMATVYFNTKQPQFARLRIYNNQQGLRRAVTQSLLATNSFFLLSALGLVALGAPLLNLLGSKTELLPREVLAFMTFMYFLELNHSVAAGVIVTGNKVPFVKAALISGILICIFSLLSVKFTNLGLWGLLVAQFVVQLGFNNWKWPMVVYREIYLKKQV